MKTSNRIHFFSYKSAFLFFVFILLMNLVFNPVMNVVGLDRLMSLFLVNTIAISVGLTGIIILIEGKFQNRKQASILFLTLLVFSAIVCYSIVYYS